MLDLKDKKILVTGGAGFVGKQVVENLILSGVNPENIRVTRSKQCDLRILENCYKAVQDQSIVIHLAAHVGGIGLNREKPAELFYDNLIMGTQLIHTAYSSGIEKFVCVGTICAYPKFTPVPFLEENLWDGYPEETNAPYGIAKKALLVQLQSYRQQYGFNGIYLLPVNLYGPGDNFDPRSSHVIPALIHKIHLAQINKEKKIEVWGDGTPTREFIYVADVAKAIVMATQNYDSAEPVNIGTGLEISIKDLTNLIAEIMEFQGQIIWQKEQPNGQPRRALDTQRAWQSFGFKAQTDLFKGIKETVDWYRTNLA
ncbi:MAG: GDP-L-fucose synthase [Cyanobacteriota bacterium ELA615]